MYTTPARIYIPPRERMESCELLFVQAEIHHVSSWNIQVIYIKWLKNGAERSQLLNFFPRRQALHVLIVPRFEKVFVPRNAHAMIPDGSDVVQG